MKSSFIFDTGYLIRVCFIETEQRLCTKGTVNRQLVTMSVLCTYIYIKELVLCVDSDCGGRYFQSLQFNLRACSGGAADADGTVLWQGALFTLRTLSHRSAAARLGTNQ